jgi:hypothetical protein
MLPKGLSFAVYGHEAFQIYRRLNKIYKSQRIVNINIYFSDQPRTANLSCPFEYQLEQLQPGVYIKVAVTH